MVNYKHKSRSEFQFCDVYRSDHVTWIDPALFTHSIVRYDTIWDAILTCNQKLTWVSLIYRTEPTTKTWKNRKTKSKLEGKYSLESTDPRKSEIRAPRQLTIALKLSCYLFVIAKLFKVEDGCLKFVYNIKIPGLRRFWTVTSTPG